MVGAGAGVTGASAEVDCRDPDVRMVPAGGRARESVVRIPSGKWVRLHSRCDPAREARDIVEQATDRQPSPAIVTVIGVGLSHLVEDVVRRWPGVRVIALELLCDTPDELRAAAGATSARDGVVVAGSAPDFALPIVTWPSEALAAEPLVIVQPIAAHFWPGLVEQARRVAQQYVYERRANEEARQRLAPIYLEHTLQNLPELVRAPDMSVLDGIANGDAVVLCGAGPSLDRLLPELRACRSRAWYVALDTALHPLVAAGIVPDLIVSIDPTRLNGRHLLGLPTRARPWLVAEMSVDPRAIRAFASRIIACRIGAADPWPWFERSGISVGKVRAWGSVLTTACDVVRRMHPSHVAFAGIDLAYTNGQPYCRGTVFEEDWEAQRIRDGLPSIEDVWQARLAGQRVSEPDVRGQDVHTAEHMLAFRNWVRTFVGEDARCEHANVSGAGILHGPSIEQSTLSVWLAPQRDASHARARLTEAAQRSRPGAHAAAAALAASNVDPDVWRSWASRVPRVERGRIGQLVEHAARELRAREGALAVSGSSEWVDVPFDPSQFFAMEPMAWQVADANVGTYAYKVDGKTMTLSFKINHSTLAGEPSKELYLRVPGNYVAARGAANAVWIGSRALKETGYVTVHPGHDFVVVHRANEEPFPMEKGDFFLFGQLLLEVQ